MKIIDKIKNGTATEIAEIMYGDLMVCACHNGTDESLDCDGMEYTDGDKCVRCIAEWLNKDA